MNNILWIIAITLMAVFSFAAYPNVDKVRYPTFKTHATPQPRKPKRVESIIPVPKKEKNLMREIEKAQEQREVANADPIQ